MSAARLAKQQRLARHEAMTYAEILATPQPRMRFPYNYCAVCERPRNSRHHRFTCSAGKVKALDE